MKHVSTKTANFSDLNQIFCDLRLSIQTVHHLQFLFYSEMRLSLNLVSFLSLVILSQIQQSESKDLVTKDELKIILQQWKEEILKELGNSGPNKETLPQKVKRLDDTVGKLANWVQCKHI